MSDRAEAGASVTALLASAEVLSDQARDPLRSDAIQRMTELLRAAEDATPGAAFFHAQLDTLRRWAGLLASGDHERFGGTQRVRDHLAVQFRLARSAAEDYWRVTGSSA
jgi:hypothetical protein